MRSHVRRASGLLQRYRIDRRLPPVVLDLFRASRRLRTSEAAAVRSASRTRPIGLVEGDDPDDVTARLGGRRVRVAGPTEAGSHQAGLDIAGHVVSVLEAAGLHPFVTDRSGGRIVIGLRLDERQHALDALAAKAEPGWFIEWADRGAIGLVPLGDAASDRRARVARNWVVFAATRWGERATGPERGVSIGFYTLGTSGELERVGVRGHDRFDPRCEPTTEVIDGRNFPGLSAFPVGRSLIHFDEPIHAVYTWVDGSDEGWIDSFRRTAEAHGRNIDEVALNAARYRSRDELRYSLRSLWSHCDWFEHIWVVTAGQRPGWLVENDRLTVVGHSDILPADALPTFNSHSIESALHHIDGLAEHFVYFNDDMLIARPLPPEAFFTPNGLARVFQSGARVPGVEDDDTLAVDTGARRGRELLDAAFGRVVPDKPLHSPYPNRRSALDDLERHFPEAVHRTRHSRFRSPTDVSIAASFAQHYAVATGRAVFGEISNQYVNVESDRMSVALDRIRLADDVDTYCINETFDAGVHEGRERQLAEFFNTMLPVASPWERS